LGLTNVKYEINKQSKYKFWTVISEISANDLMGREKNAISNQSLFSGIIIIIIIIMN